MASSIKHLDYSLNDRPVTTSFFLSSKYLKLKSLEGRASASGYATSWHCKSITGLSKGYHTVVTGLLKGYHRVIKGLSQGYHRVITGISKGYHMDNT